MPPVAGPALQVNEPRPNRSMDWLVATVVQVAPLSVDTSTSAAGEATPPGWDANTSIPLRIVG